MIHNVMSLNGKGSGGETDIGESVAARCHRPAVMFVECDAKTDALESSAVATIGQSGSMPRSPDAEGPLGS